CSSSERMATSLDSGDQEDEHSCFSDNTHADFVANQLGIMNVYFGQYGSFKGNGLDSVVAAVAPELNNEICQTLHQVAEAINKIPQPIDKILVSPEKSAGRMKMEKAITLLQKQAQLLKQVSKPLGINVIIAAE
ncbi:MAG: iron-regulated protein, partial [Lentisphaeraceae bacterium]|nr:iron-regulated protein [Lentisphaeraceae bacterium]